MGGKAMRKGGKGFKLLMLMWQKLFGAMGHLRHSDLCLESDEVGTNKPKRKHLRACELKYGHLMQKIVTNRYLQ